MAMSVRPGSGISPESERPKSTRRTRGSDDEQERRSRLLLPHEGSSLRRLAPRGADWRLTRRGSGPTSF
jgi:hypothetical protein